MRRDAHTLQVGLTRPVLLPDRPAIAALLDALGCAGTQVDDDPHVREALQRLEAAGHLTGPSTSDAGAPAVVSLQTFGPGLADRASPILDIAGLRDEPDAEVVIVVSAGPLQRSVADDLVQAGLPHLLVASVEGGWRIGPFVVPGMTACLRCVDAHESAADPRHALLVEQAARAARDDPPPTDPLTEQWALTWAARDLRTYLDGGEPGTWSTTVDLPAPEEPTSAPRITRWLRHPECGCAWDLLLDLP